MGTEEEDLALSFISAFLLFLWDAAFWECWDAEPGIIGLIIGSSQSRDLPQNPKFHPWVFQRSLCLSRGVWAWINPNPTWAGAALDAPRSGWKNPSKCKEVFYCLASPCLVNSVWQCCDRVPELRLCLALLSLPFYVDFLYFFFNILFPSWNYFPENKCF